MGGGTTEIHNDDDALATGTHEGVDSATTLRVKGADFKSCGVIEDLYIENETQSTASLVATVTEDEITTDDDISWNNGDTYNIYKTGTKGSFISSVWIDLSRGWKTDPDEMRLGWRYDDIDLDRDGERIFGPGQPE